MGLTLDGKDLRSLHDAVQTLLSPADHVHVDVWRRRVIEIFGPLIGAGNEPSLAR